MSLVTTTHTGYMVWFYFCDFHGRVVWWWC